MSTTNSFWDKYSQLINVSEGDHTLEEVLSAVSRSVNRVWLLCNSKNIVYSISFTESKKYPAVGRILPIIKEYDFNYITKIGSYHSHEYSDVTKTLVVYFKDCSVEEDRMFPLVGGFRNKALGTVPHNRRPRGVVTSMSAFGGNRESETHKVMSDHIRNHGKIISKIPDSEKKIFRLLEKVVSATK